MKKELWKDWPEPFVLANNEANLAYPIVSACDFCLGAARQIAFLHPRVSVAASSTNDRAVVEESLTLPVWLGFLSHEVAWIVEASDLIVGASGCGFR